MMPRLDDRERGAIAFRPSDSASAGGRRIYARVRLCGFGSRETEALAVAEAVRDAPQQHPEWRIADPGARDPRARDRACTA